MQLPSAAIRRILVIKWSALGDVAMATAIMQDIRAAFPDAAIDLNTLPSAAALFAHDPRFEHVIDIDVRARSGRLRRNLQWLRRVRAGRYDLVIDLQGSDRTRLLLALLRLGGHRIPCVIGVRSGFPYDLSAPARPGHVHAFARMRALLAAAGIPATTTRPVLYPSQADLLQAEATMTRVGLAPDRFAVFLPGSQAGGSFKRWGKARYAALGRLLLKRDVDRIAIIGGPEEVEDCAGIAAAINGAAGQAAVNLNMLPLLQVAPVCARARCIVANDTGNAHFAAAAGRPLLVICGPTDPRRVCPIGAGVRAIQADHGCLSCYGKVCRLGPDPPCLAAIQPGQVLAALLRADPAPTGIRVFEAGMI